jgi:hypothetical protein
MYHIQYEVPFYASFNEDLLEKILSTFKFIDQEQNLSIADPGPIDITKWNSYTDENYGFEIKYPSHWGYRESDVGVVFDIEKFFDNPPCTACDRGHLLYLSIMSLPDFLEEYNAETFEDYLQSYNFSWLEKPVEIDINNTKWYCAEQDGPGVHETCLHLNNNNVFIASLVFNDDRNSLKPYLTEIVLSTFKFTSTPTTKGTGQFCGGIAAIGCPTGYECRLDGNYPDAGGKCQIISE